MRAHEFEREQLWIYPMPACKKSNFSHKLYAAGR